MIIKTIYTYYEKITSYKLKATTCELFLSACKLPVDLY